MIKSIEALLEKETERIRLMEKELRQLPEGSLYCIKRNGKVFFYQAIGGRRIGITDDQDLIYELARKKYLKKSINDHRKALSAIAERGAVGQTRGVQTSIKKLIEYFREMQMDIVRITCTRKQYSWMKAYYVQNPVYRNQLVYRTSSGVMVRTKSELIIANALEMRGIPYRYEQGLNVEVDWMDGVVGSEDGKYKYYYPDFLIKTFDGRIIIWEHLGRVDMSNYRTHNMEKICAYRQGAGYEESQLILTFEKDLGSADSIKEIIDQRIMIHM